MNPFQEQMKNDMSFHKSLKTNQEEKTMKIDTDTTAGKIAVMQAQLNGQTIQANNGDNFGWISIPTNKNPLWKWSKFDYRIKPQTVEEAAIDYSKAKYQTCADHVDIRTDFKAGAKWREENPTDQTQ